MHNMIKKTENGVARKHNVLLSDLLVFLDGEGNNTCETLLTYDPHKRGVKETIEVFNLTKKQLQFHRPQGGVTIVEPTGVIELRSPFLSDEISRYNTTQYKEMIGPDKVAIVRVTSAGGHYSFRDLGPESYLGGFDPTLIKEHPASNTDNPIHKDHTFYISVSKEQLDSVSGGLFLADVGITMGYITDTIENKYLIQHGLHIDQPDSSVSWIFTVVGSRKDYPNLCLSHLGVIEKLPMRNDMVEDKIEVFRSCGNKKEVVIVSTTIADAVENGLSFTLNGVDYNIPVFESVASARTFRTVKEKLLIDEIIRLKRERASFQQEMDKLKSIRDRTEDKERNFLTKVLTFLMGIFPAVKKLITAFF